MIIYCCKWEPWTVTFKDVLPIKGFEPSVYIRLSKMLCFSKTIFIVYLKQHYVLKSLAYDGFFLMIKWDREAMLELVWRSYRLLHFQFFQKICIAICIVLRIFFWFCLGTALPLHLSAANCSQNNQTRQFANSSCQRELADPTHFKLISDVQMKVALLCARRFN